MKCRFFYLRPFQHRRPSRFLSAVFSPPRFAHKKNHRKGGFFYGRIDWTRTSDLFVPNEAFYQAELQSESRTYVYHIILF